MALYHVLLNSWISALGSSEATIRMLSVLFAVMTVPALYAVGARLFSRRVGVVAAVLLALNTALYSYAREARSYSLTLLLVLGASYFLVRATSQPQRRIFWAAYGVTAVLSVYAHFFAALVLLAHAVSLVAARTATRPAPYDRRGHSRCDCRRAGSGRPLHLGRRNGTHDRPGDRAKRRARPLLLVRGLESTTCRPIRARRARWLRRYVATRRSGQLGFRIRQCLASAADCARARDLRDDRSAVRLSLSARLPSGAVAPRGSGRCRDWQVVGTRPSMASDR